MSEQAASQKPRTKETITAVIGTSAAVITAALIVWLATGEGHTLGGWPVFFLCAALAFLINWLMFIHAWVTRTEHYYDITGTLTYLVMVWFAVWASGAWHAQGLLLAVLITVWTSRLGVFLFRRIRAAGEDRRFRFMKTHAPTFLMTWTLQGLWVFLTSACALVAITSQSGGTINALVYAGVALWLVGFAIEVVADRQKSEFRADPQNANRFISSGLWAWSRHPNYFGEILLWIGIALIALPALNGTQYATLISPIWVYVLLRYISGVRMLEERAKKQWGEDPEFQSYLARTPALMLRPPKSA